MVGKPVDRALKGMVWDGDDGTPPGEGNGGSRHCQAAERNAMRKDRNDMLNRSSATASLLVGFGDSSCGSRLNYRGLLIARSSRGIT